MARMSWAKPPSVLVIGGTETFLRDREIRNAILVTARSGRPITYAESDADAVDALTVAGTFGEAQLIIIPIKGVKAETIKDLQETPLPRTCLLITVDGKVDEKKYDVLELIHAGFRLEHTKPTTKKGLRELAIRFAKAEASSLLGGNKKALDSKLAEALVNAVGPDLGIVAHEISKMAALARHCGRDAITVGDVRALVRAAADLDIEPLRVGLRQRNGRKVAEAMDRIRRTSASPPTMLLLRGKGGPADLILTWLRCAILLKRGAESGEISSRIGVPEWAVTRDVIPAARKWDVKTLRWLVAELARVDRGVLRGAPSPWVACETALLLGCAG